MKRLLATTSVLATVLAGVCGSAQASPTQAPPIARAYDTEVSPDNEFKALPEVVYSAGSGENQSYLVLQWNDDREESAIIIRYRWSGTKTGYDMFHDVLQAYPQLYARVCDSEMGYTIGGIGFDRDADLNIGLRHTNGSTILPATQEERLFEAAYKSYDYDGYSPVDTDDLWQGGWTSSGTGYWSFWTKPSITGDFTYSQKGISNAVLSDGCVHGWFFNFWTASEKSWKPLASIPNSTETLASDGLYFDLIDWAEPPAAHISWGGKPTGSDIIIPDYVTDGKGIRYVVNAIEKGNLFKGRSGINSITVGSNVETVSDEAFANMPDLKRILFRGNVRRLGNKAIAGNTSLSMVQMPDKWRCTNLGTYTFSGDRALLRVPVPANAVHIPEHYADATAITALELPLTVRTIGKYAFADCSRLVDIKLNDGLTKLDDYALRGVGVTTLDIPLSVRELGIYSTAISTLRSVIVHSQTPAAVPVNSLSFTDPLPSGIRLIVPSGSEEAYATAEDWQRFKEADAMATQFPFSIEKGTIFTDASSGIRFKILSTVPTECALITSSGTIPTQWSSYGHTTGYAVADAEKYTGCKSVTVPSVANYPIELAGQKIEYPFNVVEIDDFAFQNLNADPTKPLFIVDENGDEVKFIRRIGNYAFAGAKMGQLQLPACVRELGTGAFRGCTSLSYLSRVYGTECLIEEVPDECFYGCTQMSTCDLLTGRTSRIGNDAFYNCYTLALTSTQSELNLEKLGRNAFYNCSKLNLALPSTLRWFDDSCLSGTALAAESEVTMCPEHHYGSEVFNGTTNLTKLYVKEGINELSERFCYNARNLAEITLPASLLSLGEGAFYQTAISSIVFPPAITKVPEDVCMGCTSLKNVMLADGTTEIGESAFYFSGLESFDLPSSVEVINQDAFGSCSRLSAFNIPEDSHLRELSGFGRDFALKSIHIPNGVTYLGPNAFTNCTSLSNVTGGTNLKRIGANAFYSCSALKEFIFPDNLTLIEDMAFSNTGLETIVLPSNGVILGKKAIYNNKSLKSVVVTDNTYVCEDALVSNKETMYLWDCITTNYHGYRNMDMELNYLVTHDFMDMLYSYLPVQSYNHFVLHGLAADFKKWSSYCNGDVVEINVGFSYPEGHNVQPDETSCVIEMTPELTLKSEEAGITDPSVIPAEFRKADFRRYCDRALTLTVSYREKGSEEWIAGTIQEIPYDEIPDTPEVIETNGDNMQIAAREASRAVANSDIPSYRAVFAGLKAATTYEYKLGGSNGEDSVHEFTTSLPTGVESVSTDANEAAEWYTLDGIRVEKPSKGIYIRVSGNERSKVTL